MLEGGSFPQITLGHLPASTYYSHSCWTQTHAYRIAQKYALKPVQDQSVYWEGVTDERVQPLPHVWICRLHTSFSCFDVWKTGGKKHIMYTNNHFFFCVGDMNTFYLPQSHLSTEYYHAAIKISYFVWEINFQFFSFSHWFYAKTITKWNDLNAELQTLSCISECEKIKVYISLWRLCGDRQKAKLICPNKSKGQMHYSISKEQQTKRKNRTIKPAADMAEHTGGSNGTNTVSYCKTDQTLINKIWKPLMSG